jgi:hypothetical protein
MKVYLRKPKHHESESFSFPNATAGLTDEIIDEHQMRRALTRFAKALAEQLQKKRRSLVAVDICGIDFQMIYAGTRKEPCTNPLRGNTHPDALPGHCGHCKSFRVTKRKKPKNLKKRKRGSIGG